MVWCRSEEIGRKNVTRALTGEGIMYVKYMAKERGNKEGDIQNW